MKIILSPAKSLNDSANYNGISSTEISFPKETNRLSLKLKKLSVGQIEKLMHISKDLATLNHSRFQQFSTDFTTDNSLPAGFIFNGAAYKGLDFLNLTIEEQKEGQKRLRILSGMYGILKPFDLVQPYRLEMGTRLSITPKITNLYKFWGDKIQNYLETELREENSRLIVNVASSEYFKAANLTKMKDVEIITPVFKDLNKKGEYKVNMQFAKQSRGKMTRFIIQNKIEKAEHLKAFDAGGYYFSNSLSTEKDFVFLREK